MKQFVKISFCTLCGIPYVTLEGTPQDWEKVKVIANALLALADGELNWWLGPLNQALDIMCKTAANEDTEKDWINFLNYSSSSGFHGCNGWLNAFLPFVKEPSYSGFKIVPNAVLTEGGKDTMTNFSNYLPTTSVEVYPWYYGGQLYKNLYVTAGLVDVIQWTGQDYALEPFMGYQIDATK